MDTKKIMRYLKSLHLILNVPISYHVPNEPMHEFLPFSLDTNENNTEFVYDRLKHIFKKTVLPDAVYYFTKNLIMLGIVMNRQTDEFVFVGPIASPQTTEADIADYLFATNLSTDTTKKIANYMCSTPPPLTFDEFKELLVNINIIINDNILDPSQLGEMYDSEYDEKVYLTERTLSTELEYLEKRNTASIEQYNNQLNYCILNGDLDELTNLLNDLGKFEFAEANDQLGIRQMQINAFGSVFAAETIARKSGVSPADLDKIKQFYLYRIDNSKTAADIHRLIINMLYEFTKQVRDYIAVKTTNPTINRAIEYIKTNITSKLLAEDIAGALHINLHYLFSKFKEETGKTLTQFINEEKIKRACHYLLFTNKSLVDISNYLSFSSQSYFQTVFKKLMGQTPADWRKNNKQ